MGVLPEVLWDGAHVSELHLLPKFATVTDFFKAPWDGWYRVTTDGLDEINFQIQEKGKRNRVRWRERPHAVAAGVSTYEMGKVDATGRWSFAGTGGTNAAKCQVDIWMEARDVLECDHTILDVGFLGRRRRPVEAWLSI